MAKLNAPIKKLRINGVLYAKYSIEENISSEGSVLFIKQIRPLLPPEQGNPEEFLATIISAIEKKLFVGMSYLNI